MNDRIEAELIQQIFWKHCETNIASKMPTVGAFCIQPEDTNSGV